MFLNSEFKMSGGGGGVKGPRADNMPRVPQNDNPALFTATMMILFKLTIFNYYFVFLNCQISTFKKVASCVNYKIKPKQSNFERNAKTI